MIKFFGFAALTPKMEMMYTYQVRNFSPQLRNQGSLRGLKQCRRQSKRSLGGTKMDCAFARKN